MGPGYYEAQGRSDFNKAVEIRDTGVMYLTTERFGYAPGMQIPETSKPEYAGMGPGQYNFSGSMVEKPAAAKKKPKGILKAPASSDDEDAGESKQEAGAG